MIRGRLGIAGLMGVVVLAAILLTVFRYGSFAGLLALLPLGVTSLFSRLGSGPSIRRSTFCLGVIGTLVLPFLAAVSLNNQMWGYYVFRPSVDRRIVEAGSIETVTYVETRSDTNGVRELAGVPVGSEGIDRFIPVNSYEGDYYVLEGRVLRALKGRKVLPTEGRGMAAGRLRGLYQTLEATGRLESGETGYDDAKNLRGIVVEAVGRDGLPLLFVGACGQQVSNDHYPYYEFLFADDPGGAPKLLSAQRFYYDVAGIEGLEWPMFLPVFTIGGLAATLLLQGILLRWGRRRAQSAEPPPNTSATGPDLVIP